MPSNSAPLPASSIVRRLLCRVALASVFVVALTGTGCTTGDQTVRSTSPPTTSGESRAGFQGRPITPAAEPGSAPKPVRQPKGRVIALPANSKPWGIAYDRATGRVLAALRGPPRLAAYEPRTEQMTIAKAPGAARMIDLVAPGGPLLYPAETTDTLARIAPSSLAALDMTRAGRAPHQAVMVGKTAFVTNEFGHAVRVLRDGRTVRLFGQPVQPGGITATSGRVAAVDVATNTLFVYDVASLKLVAALPAGQGPSHVVPIGGGRVAVSDVRGNAVLTYDLTGAPRPLGRVSVPGRAFWIEANPATDTIYTALSNKNLIVSLRVRDDGSMKRIAAVPTVRQPNSFELDATTGTIYVGGYTNSEIQIIPTTAFTR